MAGTVNVELAGLKAMLRKAQAWGKLADHPCAAVKPLKEIHTEARFLTEEEESRLLASSPPALGRLIRIGLLTGFRRQELAFLRADDIDFERGTVSVAACFSKNGETRTIPMGTRLQTLLREALTIHGDASTVLVTDAGLPWTPSAITAPSAPLAPALPRPSPIGPRCPRP